MSKQLTSSNTFAGTYLEICLKCRKIIFFPLSYFFKRQTSITCYGHTQCALVNAIGSKFYQHKKKSNCRETAGNIFFDKNCDIWKSAAPDQVGNFTKGHAIIRRTIRWSRVCNYRTIRYREHIDPLHIETTGNTGKLRGMRQIDHNVSKSWRDTEKSITPLEAPLQELLDQEKKMAKFVRENTQKMQ